MSEPIRIRDAAAILGVEEAVIRGAINAKELSSTGPGNSWVYLSACVAYLRGVDAIDTCPTCGEAIATAATERDDG